LGEREGEGEGEKEARGAASKSRERERERERKKEWERGLLVVRVTGGINFSIYSTFFEPVRFGSVRVNRFLHYKTENRTEPGFFLTILISLIGFFSRFDFFS